MKDFLKDMWAGAAFWVIISAFVFLIYNLTLVGRWLYAKWMWETVITCASLGFLYLTYVIGKSLRNRFRIVEDETRR